MLACILACLHPHILMFMCACFYHCILTSSFSYPKVHVFLLISSHPHILVCSGLCVLLTQVNVFSIRMNDCILVSSSSSFLGNYASHFVNNLQIIRTRQAFVLDFYRTSRKIYRKQTSSAHLKRR